MNKEIKKQKTILICQNDKIKDSELRNIFKNFDSKLIYCSLAQDAVDICIKSIIDLLIVDLSLPDKDGMYVIETLRSFNNVLPIIVTSSRSDIESKIMAFEAGASDFLVKPYNNLELLIRTKNQIRRNAIEENHLFVNGKLMIDFDAKKIFANGVEVHFTNFEYKIVVLLANNLNKTLTHEYIINHVWGYKDQDQNGLRVFMAGIRKKLSRYFNTTGLLTTYVGVGYRMNTID